MSAEGVNRSLLTVADATALVTCLARAGALTRPHSQRSLFDHLIGVREILRRWNMSPEVCSAGLFHSVYGTESFSATRPLISREAVRAAIGQTSEELVFLFGRKQSREFLTLAFDVAAVANVPAIETPSRFISDRHTGERITISNDQFSGILHLVVANILEQAPYVSEKDLRLTGLLSLTSLLVPAAARDLRAKANDG